MHSSAQGIRITHREYISDMSIGTAASPFTSQFVINPGDTKIFPWLSQIARNFTQWVPCGMAFEMKSTVLHGINAVNPQYGTFTMATNYDVYAAVFGNDRVRMLNHFFASSGGPIDNQLHLIECAPDQLAIKPLFIRQGNSLDDGFEEETKVATLPTLTLHTAPTYDARLYDLGRLEVLGINAPVTAGTYVIGELWISYDIILLKPQIKSFEGATYESHYTVPLLSQTYTVYDEFNQAVTDVEAT